MAKVVCIPYDRLLDSSSDLSRELVEVNSAGLKGSHEPECIATAPRCIASFVVLGPMLVVPMQGYGPNGLGIITVSGVPNYQQLRQGLLPLAQDFASLPDEVKTAHEDSASSYNVGWSHGKEALRSGRKDIHKGSFYANPMQDTYDVDQDTVDKYSAYYRDNIWPRAHLPELETAFKRLGSLIVAVGLKLAGHCSRYVQQQLVNATGEPLDRLQQQQLDFERQLRSSSCHKARLLHYFPVDNTAQQSAAGQQDEDWCGWHLDHGALTGLTSAMYIQDGRQVPNPDPSAGLYICDRSGHIVQASIPADHIAYQMGQVMAIQSGGLLRATPHYVRAAGGGPRASRNTFAVFMQPETSLRLDPPRGAEALGTLLCLDSGHWKPGMTFGEFADLTMHGYYTQEAQAAAAAGAQGRHSKDVAPAAVHAAAAAADRTFKGVSLLVSHE